MAVLVTGVAGFIGMHVARALLSRGEAVVGIDSLNDYYDPQLKRDRLAELRQLNGDFTFHQLDFADHEALERAVAERPVDRIVHLGAQAGVRHSIDNPRAYVRANVVGHLNVLEVARHTSVRHMVYASSSSVYGGNTALPFRVSDRVDHPVSLYAATKKSDELMSETYAHLYRVPLTGLRFFTVYGPWGRPDMAPWIFTRAILAGEPIAVFNEGRMKRDFTYIDDVVAGVIGCLDTPPVDDGTPKPGGSSAPHAIHNLGNHRSEALGELIDRIEAACGRPAVRELKPMQPGDVPATYADIEPLREAIGYEPTTTIADGVPRFVEWYRAYTGQ